MNARTALLSLVVVLVACEDEPDCSEDPRALRLDEQVEVVLAGERIAAELADDASERERGWMHRHCEREALLLVPDAPASALPVWGCALVDTLEVAFVRDGQIIALTRVEPCAEPCGACPIVGADQHVDAVLELPADTHALALGDAVRW